MRTRVIQSYRTIDVPAWIDTCMGSVQKWSEASQFDYQFVGDDIFDRVPAWYLEKTSVYPQISTDLGRLYLLEEAFAEGYDRAIWLDADVLVFAPDSFSVTLTSGFAFGRELWIQQDKRGKPKAYRNVHNAYAVFCADNRFLSFYQYACEQVIRRMESGENLGMAPQVVGPKLLTSLYNTLGFDLTHDIAMFSPDVLRDIDAGGGPSLSLLRENLAEPLAGANLCSSLEHDVGGSAFMERVCERLLASPDIVQPAARP